MHSFREWHVRWFPAVTSQWIDPEVMGGDIDIKAWARLHLHKGAGIVVREEGKGWFRLQSEDLL